MPLPDGSIAAVQLDFDVIRRLGEVARSYGLAGCVQHGASTLPDELFHHFPAVETAEIHLATGFQNLLFEHPAFPAELHRAIRRMVLRECRRRAQAGRRPTNSSSTRPARRPSGRSSASCGTCETRDEILSALRRKVSFLFTELQVTGSNELIARYIKPIDEHRPLPESLRAVSAG